MASITKRITVLRSKKLMWWKQWELFSSVEQPGRKCSAQVFCAYIHWKVGLRLFLRRFILSLIKGQEQACTTHFVLQGTMRSKNGRWTHPGFHKKQKTSPGTSKMCGKKCEVCRQLTFTQGAYGSWRWAVNFQVTYETIHYALLCSSGYFSGHSTTPITSWLHSFSLFKRQYHLFVMRLRYFEC